MNLTDEELQKIADSLFEKLIKHQDKYEEETKHYMIYDNFGNSKTVSEKDFYINEVERLIELEKDYAENEEYEKAKIISNKIKNIKIKLNKLDF
jgi:hypothetical protein